MPTPRLPRRFCGGSAAALTLGSATPKTAARHHAAILPIAKPLPGQQALPFEPNPKSQQEPRPMNSPRPTATGCLVPPSAAARLLGITDAEVQRRIDRGLLATETIRGSKYVRVDLNDDDSPAA